MFERFSTFYFFFLIFHHLFFFLLTELAGSGTRSFRRANVHRQGDHEDYAESPEVVEMRTGGSAAGGRIVRQYPVLKAVRSELAKTQHEKQREKVR